MPSLLTRILDDLEDHDWDRRSHQCRAQQLAEEFFRQYGTNWPLYQILTARAAWSAAKHRSSKAALGDLYEFTIDDRIETGSTAEMAETNLARVLEHRPRRQLQGIWQLRGQLGDGDAS